MFAGLSIAPIERWREVTHSSVEDLVAFAFDLDGHGQQIWDRVEALVEPRVLRAYVAHMALRRTDWAIRHRPEDVPRQLDRAERVLDH